MKILMRIREKYQVNIGLIVKKKPDIDPKTTTIKPLTKKFYIKIKSISFQ